MQVSYPLCLISGSWRYTGLEFGCLNSDQYSWAPFPSRALFHGISLSRSLERLNWLSGKSGLYPCYCFAFPHRILRVTTSKAFPNFPPSISPSCFGSTEFQKHTSPSWFFHHLYQKVLFNDLQELPELPACACAGSPTNIRMVEVPQEKQDL